MNNISLILFLPLWIFLTIMCGRFFAVYINKKIINVVTLAASFLGVFITGTALYKISVPIEVSYPFIKINSFVLSFGLRIDKLSLTLALLLFIISFSIQWYSISYTKNDKKNYRFFALLNLFNFGMAFLLFSPNLFQMYVFWEIVGIVSYLLIGFNYTSNKKSVASKRVFIVNRIGDTALISAIIFTSYFMVSYSGDNSLATLALDNIDITAILLNTYASAPVYFGIALLFITAAAVKSAQIPFYTWLQDAMEAESPVSALLHSATMVAAGVYLILRLLPIFILNKFLLTTIIIIGIVTTVICSILACIETYPKRILAYSTSANLGLMFIAAGMLNIKLTVSILVAHAFIKSLLFLLVPRDKKISYTNFALLIITSLSFAGILFSGCSFKEMLYETVNNKIIKYILMFISFSGAFYITRLVFIIHDKTEKVKPIKLTEFIPLMILALCNIVLYFVFKGSYRIEEPFAASLGGICLALLLYKHNTIYKLSKTPKILEKFNYNIVPNGFENITKLTLCAEEKIFGNYQIIKKVSKFIVNTVNFVEQSVMNESVEIISYLFKSFSIHDTKLQSKNVQTYNAYAFIIITIITILIIISRLFIPDGM